MGEALVQGLLDAGWDRRRPRRRRNRPRTPSGVGAPFPGAPGPEPGLGRRRADVLLVAVKPGDVAAALESPRRRSGRDAGPVDRGGGQIADAPIARSRLARSCARCRTPPRSSGGARGDLGRQVARDPTSISRSGCSVRSASSYASTSSCSTRSPGCRARDRRTFLDRRGADRRRRVRRAAARPPTARRADAARLRDVARRDRRRARGAPRRGHVARRHDRGRAPVLEGRLRTAILDAVEAATTLARARPGQATGDPPPAARAARRCSPDSRSRPGPTRARRPRPIGYLRAGAPAGRPTGAHLPPQSRRQRLVHREEVRDALAPLNSGGPGHGPGHLVRGDGRAAGIDELDELTPDEVEQALLRTHGFFAGGPSVRARRSIPTAPWRGSGAASRTGRRRGRPRWPHRLRDRTAHVAPVALPAPRAHHPHGRRRPVARGCERFGPFRAARARSGVRPLVGRRRIDGRDRRCRASSPTTRGFESGDEWSFAVGRVQTSRSPTAGTPAMEGHGRVETVSVRGPRPHCACPPPRFRVRRAGTRFALSVTLVPPPDNPPTSPGHVRRG